MGSIDKNEDGEAVVWAAESKLVLIGLIDTPPPKSDVDCSLSPAEG